MNIFRVENFFIGSYFFNLLTAKNHIRWKEALSKRRIQQNLY